MQGSINAGAGIVPRLARITHIVFLILNFAVRDIFAVVSKAKQSQSPVYFPLKFRLVLKFFVKWTYVVSACVVEIVPTTPPKLEDLFWRLSTINQHGSIFMKKLCR